MKKPNYTVNRSFCSFIKLREEIEEERREAPPGGGGGSGHLFEDDFSFLIFWLSPTPIGAWPSAPISDTMFQL